MPNGLPHADQISRQAADVEQVRWVCNAWGRCWWRGRRRARGRIGIEVHVVAAGDAAAQHLRGTQQRCVVNEIRRNETAFARPDVIFEPGLQRHVVRMQVLTPPARRPDDLVRPDGHATVFATLAGTEAMIAAMQAAGVPILLIGALATLSCGKDEPVAVEFVNPSLTSQNLDDKKKR